MFNYVKSLLIPQTKVHVRLLSTSYHFQNNTLLSQVSVVVFDRRRRTSIKVCLIAYSAINDLSSQSAQKFFQILVLERLVKTAGINTLLSTLAMNTWKAIGILSFFIAALGVIVEILQHLFASDNASNKDHSLNISKCPGAFELSIYEYSDLH